MLHLIFGRSGFGKTAEALKTAGKAAENGKKVVIMVPEQFTFETERTVIHDFGEKSCLNIEVLSFARLVHRVMSLYGGLASHYIDDCGRNVLMKLALTQIKDMLKVYSKQSQNAAFVKTMVTAVSEYKVCAVDADMIEEASKTAENSLLREKLSDISLIMRTYCAMLDSSFADPLDDLTRLAKKLPDSPFFDGKTVIIDGFKGFTPQERKVIGEIIKSADDIYVTLCADSLGSENSSGLFSPVEKTARLLIKFANKNSVPVASPIKLTEPHRFLNATLTQFEKRIFRPEAKPFIEDAPEISIISAQNTYDEVQFAACEITKLVRENGCRYNEIAVISRGNDLYDGILDTVFEKYGIPLFYDARRGVATHPLMALVLSLMSIITDNFRQSNVLRFLKTGLAGFDTLEVSRLENYMLMWNINGEDMWKEEFKESPEGFSGAMSEDSVKELAELNDLREKFYLPIKKLKEDFDKKDKAEALYSYLCNIGIREAVNAACHELKEQGEIRLSGEYGQIFEKLILMLDQIHIASKNAELSTEDFAAMLSLVIENTDLGSIPPSLDAVSFGDAERIRTGGAKYVFVLGLAEGVFPQTAPSGGLITDSERRALIEMGLELSPPAEEKAAEERFFAYKAFTCASQKVYLSCPRADAAGKALRPSYFLPAVKRLFPNCSQIDEPLKNPIDTIANKKTAFDLLASGYREKTPLSFALKEVFNNIDEYSSKRDSLERASSGRRLEFKNPETARSLYGENIRISPSQEETFRKCRFMYFCKYGLKAKPRAKAELDAPQIGTVIHYVLENLLRDTKSVGISNVPPEELEAKTQKLLADFAEIYLGGLDNKPARFCHIFESLSETVNCLVKHIAEEFSQSSFKPSDFELAISEDGAVKPFEIPLDDGGKLIVRGKVDRVDTLTMNGKTYLRVIDYKSGSKTFNLGDLVYGLNLQMFIYLFILCSNNTYRYGDPEKVVPAGVLYYPAKKPDVSASRNEEDEKIESAADKELRMKGIVIDDPQIVLKMESSGEGKFVPAVVKKSDEEDGSMRFAFSGTSSIASLEQFGILKRHIEKLLKNMAKTLRSGDAAAVPISGLGENPCEYCDYSGVCGFEPGANTDTLYKIDKKDAFGKMRGENRDGE